MRKDRRQARNCQSKGKLLEKIQREARKAIKDGISTLEENGNWIKEERRIENKKDNREETVMKLDRMSEARGGGVLKADLRSEESMMEEGKPITEGEEERVLEIKRMSGSLSRNEVIQSVRTKVRKTRSQKEFIKKLPDKENRKTVKLMENSKKKGRLGFGALGPNNDPNPEVPLKIIIKIKHTSLKTC